MRDRRQRTVGDAVRVGRPLNGGRLGTIGGHSPCHRRGSLVSRCYEGRLDGQFGCRAASVRTVNIENGTRFYIDECRRFERAYVAIRVVLEVSPCRFAVEECVIDGSVRARIADCRGLPKESTPYRHGYPLKRPV